MKRWLAPFLAVFLLVSTIGQVSMAARMPCGAGQHPSAGSADTIGGHVVQSAQHADAEPSPCHDSGAKDCSDVCKRLCCNVAFVPQAVVEPAIRVTPSRVRPPMSAPLFTRTSPPDTPPPIA